MVRPNNASIGTSIINNRPLRERRGCELYPDRIDFGILKEGKHQLKLLSLNKHFSINKKCRCDIWSGN